MRFLLDENVPRDVAVALREEGHDIVWLPETSLRATDDASIWAHAASEQRVFVTADRGFPLPGAMPPGMIRLRGFDRLPTDAQAERLVAFIQSHIDDIEGQLVILTPTRSRQRLL